MSMPKKVLEEALAATPSGKAELVDYLPASLDSPDREIDQLRMEEVEGRIDAYKRGKIKVLKIGEVLQKYK